MKQRCFWAAVDGCLQSAGGKCERPPFPAIYLFFPVLGTGIWFLFFFSCYSILWELCFFSLYMWLLKCRLFMTSLCRLRFINDQLCDLGRGIVFIWHRLALVQSSSCREAERSQFCGFERCEKFKSRCKSLAFIICVCKFIFVHGVCLLNRNFRRLVKKKKSYLLMKHLSLILWQLVRWIWMVAPFHVPA